MFFNKFILKLTRDIVEVSTYKVPLYYFPFSVSIFYAPRETILLLTSIWLYNSLIENEKKKLDDDKSDKKSINRQVFTSLKDENIDEDEISSINSENENNESNTIKYMDDYLFYNLSDDENVNEGKISEEISDDENVNDGKIGEEISDDDENEGKIGEEILDDENEGKIGEEILDDENEGKIGEEISDDENEIKSDENISDEETSDDENESNDSYELDTIEDSLSVDKEDTERENKYLMFLSYFLGVRPKFD